MRKDNDASASGFTYGKAGVDIQHTDALKSEMSEYVSTGHPRVLNKMGQFASLFDFKFDDIAHPVLVLKSEEPGSKQKLAMEYGYAESICHDMINHLVNDIIVMGAAPLAVLDTIVCGSADKETIKSIVKGISDACRNNECVLVGGETSIQPGIVDAGTYILTSSIAGVVDKENIIDGSLIKDGDVVLAVASNGLHTNGYTLVRLMMSEMPQIMDDIIEGETFIESIMRPHTAYYGALKDLITGVGPTSGLDSASSLDSTSGLSSTAGLSSVSSPDSSFVHVLKGMAHITGGGIEGNLSRIIPDSLCAKIDLAKVRTLPIFKYIKNTGNISDSEMLSTFNCGVGLMLVVAPENAGVVAEHIQRYFDCYPVGEVRTGSSKVCFENSMAW